MATVLLVDDAMFMRATLRKLLAGAGYTVAGEAENGRVAVERYRELKPDLVVMDITMPEMDGLAALKAILESDPNARIVMCTALGQERTVTEALQTGARDYIMKPFKPEKVLEAVGKAIGQ